MNIHMEAGGKTPLHQAAIVGSVEEVQCKETYLLWSKARHSDKAWPHSTSLRCRKWAQRDSWDPVGIGGSSRLTKQVGKNSVTLCCQ